MAANPIKPDTADIGAHAVQYGIYHWPVFPLRGKIPAIPGGRGVLDATTDVAQITAWWTGPYKGANIGGRVPESMFVLDVDPRHGGDRSIAALEQRHGPLPETLTTVSGRGDGGTHRFYRRPLGKLSAKRLGAGVDVKTSTGYVVLPPSIHPDSRKPYICIEAPVVAPPAWLIDLLRPAPPPQLRPPVAPSMRWLCGRSIADEYGVTASWADVLEPHGWRCLDPDPDADGTRWLHPAATSAWSATVRHGCLFVYSSNTAFDITVPDDPHGYTKFRAYALLNHAGNMSAAARALTGSTR
jgi:hypothetical protein